MRLLVSIFALLTYTSGNAQMCPCEFGKSGSGKSLRYEVGLNLYSIPSDFLSKLIAPPSKDYFRPTGLMFKYHKEKASFRFGFDYIRKKVNDQHTYGNDISQYDEKGGTLRSMIGIQKTVIGKKLSLFVFSDLMWEYFHSTGNWRTESYHWGYHKSEGNFRIYKNGIGIAAGIGFNYRPIERFSISIETPVSLLIGWEKTLVNSTEESGTKRSGIKFVEGFSPTRLLSVNYHFNP